MAKENILDKVEIPQGLTVTVTGKTLSVKGPKGEISRKVNNPRVVVTVASGEVVFKAISNSKKDKSIVNTYKAHLKNAFHGASSPYKYTLKICSGHFPMNVSVSGEQLIIKNFLGEKIPRKVKLKKGASVKVEGQMITVEGPDKELAGQVAADIEQATRRPGFDNRIFQDGIYITDKSGKEI